MMGITRRKLLSSAALGGGATVLGGCDMLNDSPAFRDILTSAEDANFLVHRALGDRAELAPEYSEADLSPYFRGNGTQDPDTSDYIAAVENEFADWTVSITGMVLSPLQLSLADIRAMPQRTQITRHDCVEGWSAIGKWTGVPLKLILERAGLADGAKYVVFWCADHLGRSQSRYYESIDLIDAYHPQTILAHMLNDEALPVRNGAPLRLRVERQLGYKQAKYIQEIELVSSLNGIEGGKGGYWEDKTDYAWYAGI